MIVCGSTRVDGLIQCVCQVILTSTILEEEPQLDAVLVMLVVVVLEVVEAAEVVVAAGDVVVVEAAEDVVGVEDVEAKYMIMTYTCDQNKITNDKHTSIFLRCLTCMTVILK